LFSFAFMIVRKPVAIPTGSTRAGRPALVILIFLKLHSILDNRFWTLFCLFVGFFN
jgi:hypothetical protein